MGNALDAVLAQYEKNTQSTGGGKQISQEDRLKRYFTTYLTKRDKSGQKVFVSYLHQMVHHLSKKCGTTKYRLTVNGLNYIDPGKNDGERSPLTEVYEELMSTGKESDKELARQYRPRKFYIVKVIDRENEDHGPKFWRFKDNYKQEGILDKIIPIWRQKVMSLMLMKVVT